MSEKKKTISFVDKEVFVEGKPLRQCPLSDYFDRMGVLIYDGGADPVNDADRFNELYDEFQDRYPLDFMIQKIICQEQENEFKIEVKRRLPKVYPQYELCFFYHEYSHHESLKRKKKEIDELTMKPSLPIKDGEDTTMTVDEKKVEAIKSSISEMEAEFRSAKDRNPDLSMVLSTVKSEYKGSKTVITFAMWPDDVYRVLERKIQNINSVCALFLTPKTK